jgi:hypothetical protein
MRRSGVRFPEAALSVDVPRAQYQERASRSNVISCLHDRATLALLTNGALMKGLEVPGPAGWLLLQSGRQDRVGPSLLLATWGNVSDQVQTAATNGGAMTATVRLVARYKPPPGVSTTGGSSSGADPKVPRHATGDR